MKEIRFDDRAALHAQIHLAFGDWGPEVEITQTMINGFAEITGDRQWIHTDVERTKRESPFRRPIAHGFLTMSLLPALLPEPEIKIVGHSMVIHYGGGEFRFLSPVPAGSKVHARDRLADVKKKGRGTLITIAYEVRIVGSVKPALIGSGKVLYI